MGAYMAEQLGRRSLVPSFTRTCYLHLWLFPPSWRMWV